MKELLKASRQLERLDGVLNNRVDLSDFQIDKIQKEADQILLKFKCDNIDSRRPVLKVV